MARRSLLDANRDLVAGVLAYPSSRLAAPGVYARRRAERRSCARLMDRVGAAPVCLTRWEQTLRDARPPTGRLKPCKRWLRACQPRTIILFGSVARGDDRPGSDIDLLVVVDEESRVGLRQPGCDPPPVASLPTEIDVIVTTQARLEANRDAPGDGRQAGRARGEDRLRPCRLRACPTRRIPG